MFESQLHDANSFITLTYNDDNLPSPPSLDYRHFQLFLKRLRKVYGAVRFYACGEYGDELARPHFHACIFGTDFPDRVLHARLPSGYDLYRSKKLEALWPYGFSSVADLSFDSAAYVARYCLKKVTGELADEHYKYVDPDTGEVSQLEPEFAHMSLKPGIGGVWFDRFKDDLSEDYVVINGKKCKPPRYFDKLLRRVDPEKYNDVKEAREYRGYLSRADNTYARLEVKEHVKRAALSKLKTRSAL